MPKLELTYFAFKGFGEQLRMLLAYGGQEFTDKRLTGQEWHYYKQETPFGQVPVLEIDGKKYAQSKAIARYLGRKYGLVGADAEEDLEIDQNVEFLYEIRSRMEMYGNSKNVLKKLDEIIRANNGHLAAGKLTWADFVFAGLYDSIIVPMRVPNMDALYPSFKKLYDMVRNLPRVKEYVASTKNLSYY